MLPGSTWSLSGMAEQMAWHSAWPLSLLFFSTLSIRLILREKKNDEKNEGLMISGCRDTAIMQSMMDQSRILKLRGSESVPHPSWINNFLPLRIGRVVLSIWSDYPIDFWIFASFSFQAVLQDQK